jgi:hypothetical protein
MKLKINLEIVVDMTEQRAFDRFGTSDPYSTATAMTAEARAHASEMKRDVEMDGMEVHNVSAVVTPVHG